MPNSATNRPRVAIIGSGFSGICLGAQLRKAGIESFAIYEKADSLGGTWRDNTYPGAACDVPSFSYCFSFEQKTDWSRKWSSQAEIRDYMEHCARKYGVLPHIRFGTEIASARFDEAEAAWHLQTTTGEEVIADVLVSAVGQLNRPYIPEFPEVDRFRGERFHSARWNHACDLAGKNVAVIGNAASAIQFIPQIAPKVAHLAIFQRSANWMLPRGDRPYSEREKRLFARFPLLARLYRWWIWYQLESRFPLFRGNRFFAWRTRRFAEQNLRENIADPRLREALLPDYPIGAKRILIADDYYPALARKNVEVVTAAVDHFTEDAIVTRDGAAHPADVVIFATGFQSTAFLAPMRVEGLAGRSLEAEWAGGARAYRGMTVPGFPNFFMMYGPNTNLGHNSIIFMIECQTHYILEAITALRDGDLAYFDLRQDAMDEYNASIQTELASTVWARVEKSWYKNEAGRITNNWSGSTVRYWWTTRHFDRERYRALGRARSVGGVETPGAAERRRQDKAAAA